MSPKRKYSLHYCALQFLCMVVLFGCGGGSGIGGSGGSVPSPSFSVIFSPSSISMVAGGTASLSVQIVGQGGFSSSVSVDIAGLPDGVVATPQPLIIDANATGNLTFVADSAATVGQTTVTIKANSGSQEVDKSLGFQLNSFTPQTSPFVSIGGQIDTGFFDEGRQLLFLTDASLNEVEVLGGTPSGFEVAGYTNGHFPFSNWVGWDQSPSNIVNTQIWELGNSLSYITGRFSQQYPNVEPGPKNTEAGKKLQDCYFKNKK